MVDLGILMPDIPYADRQPTEPNESEATQSKPAELFVEQVPVPRSAICQSAIHGGPLNFDA